jgi:hypothetical protein
LTTSARKVSALHAGATTVGPASIGSARSLLRLVVTASLDRREGGEPSEDEERGIRAGLKTEDIEKVAVHVPEESNADASLERLRAPLATASA